MHSCNPLIHALHSNLEHLLPYILSQRSMSFTAPATLHMTYSGIQTSKKAQRSSSMELSVRTPIAFVPPTCLVYTHFLSLPAAMKPSPITTTPMTWLGVHDMLWQLTGIQKEYAKSQGGKVAASPPAPTRRSLRKRKPVQTLLQALDTRELSEVPEPPRKRARKSKSDESEKAREATPLAAEQPEISTEIEAGPSALSHIKPTTLPSPLEAHGTTDTTPSPLTITSSLPSDFQPSAKDDVAQASSSRGHTKDAKKVSTTQMVSRPIRRTRERSPSFSSGSSTAVSAVGSNSKRARSSSSVSSTSTTVGADTGSKSKGKGKEKATDLAEATEEETEDEADKRSRKSNRPTTKDAAPKSSRKQSGGTTKRGPEDTDKLEAAEAPRRVRKRSRVTSSRSRKARKS